MNKLRFLLLAACLMLASGCITQGLIDNHAKPHEKFDKQKQETVQVDGEPGYYVLLPFTVVADLATSPIQIPVMIAIWINGGPHF
jgi:hypothetical protein